MSQVTDHARPTFMPLGDALIYADRCRNEGRLIEAEAVCRQILRAQPNLPEAEHLLGIIAHQQGKLGEAIEHVQHAVKLAPQVAHFHANLGEMLRLAGRIDEATVYNSSIGRWRVYEHQLEPLLSALRAGTGPEF